jgi:hypothetical protein
MMAILETIRFHNPNGTLIAYLEKQAMFSSFEDSILSTRELRSSALSVHEIYAESPRFTSLHVSLRCRVFNVETREPRPDTSKKIHWLTMEIGWRVTSLQCKAPDRCVNDRYTREIDTRWDENDSANCINVNCQGQKYWLLRETSIWPDESSGESERGHVRLPMADY